MAGLFQRIFGKNEPEEALEIRIADLSSWLETEQKETRGRMDGVATASRATALAEIGNLEAAITALKEVKVDAKQVPPKLQRVVHHSIPKYVAAMEKVVAREFREDADGYYQDLADFVQTSGKTMQTKGRYITALLPDEMRAIRESVAVFGREINRLNETFREAKERLGALNRAEEKLGVVMALQKAEKLRAEEKLALTAERTALLAEITTLEEQEQQARESPAYRQAEEISEEEQNLVKAMKETEEQYARLVAISANAFRKGEYAARQKDAKTADAVQVLIDTLGRPLPGAAREAAEIYRAVYPDLLSVFAEGGILKNQTEQELFADADRISDELEEIAGHIDRLRKATEEARRELGALEILQEIRTTKAKRTACESRLESADRVLSALESAGSTFGEEYKASREALSSVLEEACGRAVELRAE